MDEGEKKRKAGMVKERMNSSHRRDFFPQKVMLPFSGWRSKNVFKAKSIHSVWKQIAILRCSSSTPKRRIMIELS
jgi:hypothetical protein